MAQPERAASYDAFISYAHEDERLAERLSRRIRRYRPPRALRRGRKKLSVFRDVERLTATADLGDELERRLASCAHLILLCSPPAVASEYVDQEISFFLGSKGRERLLVVLAAGEPDKSFPSSLLEAMEEPLFVDLKESGGWWRGWRRFRRESLRLIAALLEVDYADLSRVDERRKWRRRVTAVLGSTLLALGVASAFVINSVPPTRWESVPLPVRHAGSPLRPIQEYAVNTNDPSVLLLHAFGADYAAQVPERPVGTHLVSLPPDGESLLERAGAAFSKPRAQVEGPIALLRFELFEYSGELPIGEGRIGMFGLLTPEGKLGLGRVLEYDGESAGGGERDSLRLPLTLDSESQELFGFTPWPLDPLLDAGLMPYDGRVRGTVEFLLPGIEGVTPWELEIQDLEDSFSEPSLVWLREAVLSNLPDVEVSLCGESFPLSDVDRDLEVWEELIAQDEWIASGRSEQVTSSFSLWSRDPDGTELEVRSNGQDIELPPAILDLLRGLLEFAEELGHAVSWVKNGDLEALTVLTTVWEEIAGEVDGRALYLVRNGPEASWSVAELPTADSKTRIVDLLHVDASESFLIAVTDRAGLFASHDGGASWEGFNLGEARIASGASLEITVVPTDEGRPAIWVLADNTTDEEGAPNVLLGYRELTLLERLRIGLIERLGRSSVGTSRSAANPQAGAS